MPMALLLLVAFVIDQVFWRNSTVQALLFEIQY
jgi:hypothetical protein